MRFMMMVKADQDSEAGVMPDEKLLVAMGRYHEQLLKAGVLLAAEGLHPSSKGAYLRFSGGQRTVTDGPFAEAKELIAGFWMIQVKSKEEAIEWARRIPFEAADLDLRGGVGEVEIRQVFEESDFPAGIRESERGRAVLEAERAFREHAQRKT